MLWLRYADAPFLKQIRATLLLVAPAGDFGWGEAALLTTKANGSRTPRADMDALTRYGLGVKEVRVDLTVRQLTRLTRSVTESAIDLISRIR